MDLADSIFGIVGLIILVGAATKCLLNYWTLRRHEKNKLSHGRGVKNDDHARTELLKAIGIGLVVVFFCFTWFDSLSSSV